MKGRIHRAEHNEWLVEHEGKNYQLHPDNVEELEQIDQVFDNLGARIAANPIVEFSIVQHQKLTGIATYAKLKKL